MVYKPRKKRLPPEKVRANLIAQQARLAKPSIPKKLRRVAEQAFTEGVVEIYNKLHRGVQAAAELNSLYRPLVGEDWKETTKLLYNYTRTLPEAQRKDFIHELFQDNPLSLEDTLPVFGLGMLINNEELKRKSEPSSA